MVKLTLPKASNSPVKSMGIELRLDQITKAEPFASLFDIRPEVLEAIKADMAAKGFDPSKPVNVWKKPDGSRVLIDGYTRIRAAEELGFLSIFAHEESFISETEAVAYAIHTQKDRRNLSDAELFRILERIDEPVRGFKGAHPLNEKTPINRGSAPIPPDGGNGGKPRSTAEITATAAGISARKVERFRTVKADPEEAAAVLSGTKSINQAAEAVKAKANYSKSSAPRIGKATIRKPDSRTAAPTKALRGIIERQIKQLEKQINAESTKAAAATRATGKQSRDYLTGHVEGLTDALVLAYRLYEQIKGNA